MGDTALNSVVELPNGGWDPRVRLFRVPDEVDVAAIVGSRYVIVVDTMSTPELAEEMLRRLRPVLQTRQLLVVNTHADYDHAWGNGAFALPGGIYTAPILASAAAAARLRSPVEREYLADRLREDPRFASVRLVPPTIEIEAGGSIDAGDLTVNLIPTPGHTPDHLSLWIPEIGLVLAGDAAEHPFPYCGQESDIGTLVESLRRLQALRARTVIPCHGGTGDPDLLDRNVQYFARLDGIIRRTMAQSEPPAGWLDRPDLDRAVGYPFEAALRDQGDMEHTTAAFYRESHRLALCATIARVLDGAPPPG